MNTLLLAIFILFQKLFLTFILIVKPFSNFFVSFAILWWCGAVRPLPRDGSAKIVSLHCISI